MNLYDQVVENEFLQIVAFLKSSNALLNFLENTYLHLYLYIPYLSPYIMCHESMTFSLKNNVLSEELYFFTFYNKLYI